MALRLLFLFMSLPVIKENTHKVEDDQYIPDGFGCSFFDGEGNRIPVHIVKLYVRSHFIILEPSEQDSVLKYFPLASNR